MEFGCGGMGLRTSRRDVVNLYFWHLENQGGVCVRHADFLGRADSPRVKRELLRRMALYDRRVEQTLASAVAKLERSLAGHEPAVETHYAILEDHRARSEPAVPMVFLGAQGI